MSKQPLRSEGCTRFAGGPIPQPQSDEAPDRLAIVRADIVKTVGNMECLFRITKRAKDAIKNGEDVSVVRIRLLLPLGMVHLVYVGRNPDARQVPVEPAGNPDIRVLEESIPRRKKAVDEHRRCRQAEQPDRNDDPNEAPDPLEWMLTKSSRHVNETITVMNAMDAPQKR